MNSVNLEGNITREIDVITTVSGKTVIKFSIANNDERRKKDDGSYENIPSYFDCEYWPANPQYWINVLKKGKYVCFDGRLKQDRWTDENGNNRSKVKIAVDKFALGTIIHNKTEEKPAGEGSDDDVPF